MTSYTDEQVRRMAAFLQQEGYIAAPEMLLNMQADRTRLQAEVDASHDDAERWRAFVGLIDPDLMGGYTIYRFIDPKTDQLIYDGRDLAEQIDSARAKKGDV